VQALSTPISVDREDSFIVNAGVAQEPTGEQWARSEMDER
jgi:hypothetical protein